jgi:uncharacterized membrane protein YqhA
MKKIDMTELVLVIFMTIAGAMLIMVAISEYQDTQSRIKWRESTSLEMLETVKREAVNEYISKVDYETIHNNRPDRQAD